MHNFVFVLGSQNDSSIHYAAAHSNLSSAERRKRPMEKAHNNGTLVRDARNKLIFRKNGNFFRCSRCCTFWDPSDSEIDEESRKISSIFLNDAMNLGLLSFSALLFLRSFFQPQMINECRDKLRVILVYETIVRRR